jgi:phytoene synthase
VAGAAQPPITAGEPAGTIAIFDALGHTIRERTLPPELLEDLISAFKQDLTVDRYQTWEGLFEYARRSANPIGRLVLRIAGYHGHPLDTWSDSICTALQFTNFWQDFAVDLARGRVYLPQSELAQHGATAPDLSGTAASVSTRSALRQAVARTRQLFVAGRPLCDAVTGRLRYELRATWLGGNRILDRVEAQLDAEHLRRPTLHPRDTPWFLWRLMTWAPR